MRTFIAIVLAAAGLWVFLWCLTRPEPLTLENNEYSNIEPNRSVVVFDYPDCVVVFDDTGALDPNWLTSDTNDAEFSLGIAPGTAKITLSQPDSNALELIHDTDILITLDNTYTAITFWNDGNEVTIDWSSGKIDVVGDPNHYTEAARMFFEVYMPQGALQLVRNNSNAIRTLALEGAICNTLGHQWKTQTDTCAEICSPYTPSHVCGLCEKCEAQCP